MFGTKLRRTIRDASDRHSRDAQAQTHMLDQRMHQQNQQVSRQGNSAEVRNDIELMKAGYSSSTTIPRDVPIRCLWEPVDKQDHKGMDNWRYSEAVVTLATIAFDMKGAIEDSMYREQNSYAFMGCRIFNEVNTIPELKEMENFLRHSSLAGTFFHQYERTDHDLKLHYVLRGHVEGYWSDTSSTDLYSLRRPRWWRLEK